MKHHCGLFGVFGHPDAVHLTRLGLFAQQHRGQESAGISSSDGQRLKRHVGMGLVGDVFDAETLDKLANPMAIGHVRYSTTGSNTIRNCQPLQIEFSGGQVAVAHNGNLINATRLRADYEQAGHIFQSSCDSEVLVHLLADPDHRDTPNPLIHALNQLEGAYCLLLLFADRVVAVRDPMGFRPLSLGRTAEGAYVVASETCAFDLVDAEYLRDIQPGEMLTINETGLSSERFADPDPERGAACIFEMIYFADPSSDVFGENVHVVRESMGARTAEEAPVDADLVIPVPNCARCAAIGYARQSGIPIGRGFTTSHYAGRSFIMPSQRSRDLAVKMKLNVIKEAVRGKRLVVVEDSVVRGTTTRGKMGALRKAGARQIHLRVASSPIRHACYFGIDFPDPAELIANTRSVEQIRKYLGVDSLHYLSHQGMLECVRMAGPQYCTACFSGDYPVTVNGPVEKLALERGPLAVRS
ncbi:MAG: amidophosphoribosyltransferase [Phycisphaerae bacterium]